MMDNKRLQLISSGCKWHLYTKGDRERSEGADEGKVNFQKADPLQAELEAIFQDSGRLLSEGKNAETGYWCPFAFKKGNAPGINYVQKRPVSVLSYDSCNWFQNTGVSQGTICVGRGKGK